jgi:hypothetical protein
MNAFRSKYQAWRRRRQQRYVEWWARMRGRGEARFVLWIVSGYTLLTLAATSAADYYSEGEVHAGDLLARAVAYVLGSSLLGLFVWWSNERRYRRLLESSPTHVPQVLE